tara:strand:+ start:41 stop:370 length:330 start_codon:yes stop_codon:yes gene_type:complete
MSNVKIAEDRYQNKMQFAHLKLTSAQNLAAASTTVWDATSDRHVVITPTASDAYVSVAPNGTSTVPNGSGTGYSLGKLVTFGSSYTTIVRAGERIATSAIINVVSLGEV